MKVLGGANVSTGMVCRSYLSPIGKGKDSVLETKSDSPMGEFSLATHFGTGWRGVSPKVRPDFYTARIRSTRRPAIILDRLPFECPLTLGFVLPAFRH